MRVYTYKFNTKGFFVKCKARLVVRGDQQKVNHTEENYAATLATRSFRAVLSIAARFNLEMKQFDAVNAFVNAKIHDDVFMELPVGYRKRGRALKLNKALYGLRKSPLLWQRELMGTLSSLGFQPVPHEPCIMIRSGYLVFFYVDDIVIAYPKAQQHLATATSNGLRAKYDLTGGNDLRWFLGIDVHRDRARGLVWLAQTAYIEKIAKLAAPGRNHRTPMAMDELLPYTGIATRASTQLYQRKVGSLLYAEVVTRPDIAFAASRLARHNQNPGPEHHAAADRVLRYLYATRFLALQLGGGNDLHVACNASFADNTMDRKSSQGSIISLFGGLIAWRASKQNTVTTSTTEAELLFPVISHVCREARELVLKRHVYMSGQEGQLDDDGVPCPEWNAWNETLPLRLRKGFDMVHLHWNRSYDRLIYLPAPPNPLPYFQWLANQAAAASISAELLHPFDGGLGNSTIDLEDVKYFRPHNLYYVVLAIVEIHLTDHEAAHAGVFGRLGEEPIQLVDPRDTATVARFRDVWRCHHLPSEEPDIAELFSRAVDSAEAYRARVEQWRQELEKVWMWRKCRELGVRGETLAEIWPDPNRPTGGPFIFPFPFSFRIDWARQVRDREHPWVRAQLALMPRFEPALMFGHCSRMCAVPRNPVRMMMTVPRVAISARAARGGRAVTGGRAATGRKTRWGP